MSLAFEMKTVCVWKGVISKSQYSQKLCQNANFENGGTTIQGTTIQTGILHVLLNILSISLLSKVHGTSGYFEMQKD